MVRAYCSRRGYHGKNSLNFSHFVYRELFLTVRYICYDCMGVPVYPMSLPYPKEPVHIKNRIRRLWQAMCTTNDVNCDEKVVWNDNELARYLWGEWSAELRGYGCNWQCFLKTLRLITADIILWALKDVLTWDEVLEKFIRVLKVYYYKEGGNSVR